MHVCFCCVRFSFSLLIKRLAGKNVSKMTNFVSGGRKALTHSILLSLLLLLPTFPPLYSYSLCYSLSSTQYALNMWLSTITLLIAEYTVMDANTVSWAVSTEWSDTEPFRLVHYACMTLFTREAALELQLPSVGSQFVDGMAMVDDHHLG